MANWTVVCDDVIHWAETYSGPPFHAILTDPPYELGFMGKHWDRQGVAFQPATWAALSAHLLPGAHVLAFGGGRTHHRLMCAIEDAGLEIRDCIYWAFGSGFPKSLNVGKAIDKAAGAEREVVGLKPDPRYLSPRRNSPNHMDRARGVEGGHGADNPVAQITAPATPAAATWEGYGTALKPAVEVIVMARKPIEGTIAGNCERYGSGAINIEQCRITVKGTHLTGQRLESTMVENTGGLPWVLERNLCDSCARLAEKNGKHTAQAKKACSVQSNAEPTLSERELVSQADTSKPDTGCSDGMKAGITAMSLSTEKSGEKQMDLSQEDMSCITSMATKKTTDLRTCNSCGVRLTPVNTLLNTRPTQSVRQNTQSEPGTNGNAGRWPANLILDDSEAVAGLFPVTTQLDKRQRKIAIQPPGQHGIYGTYNGTESTPAYNDNGSAARFFYQATWELDQAEQLDAADVLRYCAKSSRAEREFGLDELPEVSKAVQYGDGLNSATKVRTKEQAQEGVNRGTCKNRHPCVKPLSLCRYLATLLLPPAAYAPRRILVPFAGVGSEMIGAGLAGWDEIVGIEQESEYTQIAEARLAYWLRQPELALR